MSNSICAYCGGEFEPFGVRRYCGPQCANNAWRLSRGEPQNAAEGTPTWRGMRDQSPDTWDEQTQYSPSAFRVERHAATCLACGRSVESADRAAWCRAVRTLQCEHCGGRILFEVENVGGLQSPTEVRIRKRTDDTPLRTRVA